MGYGQSREMDLGNAEVSQGLLDREGVENGELSWRAALEARV